ncbi:ketopantoate reductase family protein [Gluconacetobacter asukensis]|uniref:2-dehydropantoate 2-reductase n=1 Tax=Gluconacetobacter asukensis TaxID=1017181 RepID=A0A7W4J0B8_9PROT|nr:ketopantoate reductase family protein [Gluconacetobacter asukensis]MBB2172370.1 ketopantoate reductase family protein [Gluconacetobacter asukensis]
MHERIAVIGAGALGSLFAGRIAASGREVVTIDIDLARLSEIERHGIRWRENGIERHARPKAASARNIDGPINIFLFTTKATALPAAIRSVKHLAADDSTAISFSNGLRHETTLMSLSGDTTPLLAVTDVSADLVAGIIETHGRGTIWIGGVDASSRRAVATATELLRHARFTVEPQDDPRPSIWEKAAFNAALNATATIAGKPVGFLDNASGRWIFDAVAREVVSVANALGINARLSTVLERVDHALSAQGDHRPSMLQDRDAGRPTEIEAINGAIVEMAGKVNIDVPVTRTLANLVRILEPTQQARGLSAGICEGDASIRV